MQKYYITSADARSLLEARQRVGLREQVEAWWRERGFPHATCFRGRGFTATLARQVATARFEDIVFQRLAHRAGLTPLWLQSTQDKLVSSSTYKRSLTHPYLCARVGKAGPITTRVSLCSLATELGKPLRDVVCVDGASLVEYHNTRQNVYLGEVVRDDAAPLMGRFKNASEYYEYLLSFFVAHSVLFEDYHGGESGGALDAFTSQVFEPAWHRVRETFGYEPLVVTMPWWNGLQFYPDTTSWEHLGIVTEEKLERF